MEGHGTTAYSCHDHHVAVHDWLYQAHDPEVDATYGYGQCLFTDCT
jgi:hypothetical protein